MIKKILLMAVLISAGTLYAEEIYDADTIVVSNGIMLEKATMKPADGVYRIYYESGDLRYEIALKDGKRNGVTKEYAMSGWLREETPYSDGKIDGIKKFYYRTGSLMTEIPYKNGKQEGTVKHYREDGSARE